MQPGARDERARRRRGASRDGPVRRGTGCVRSRWHALTADRCARSASGRRGLHHEEDGLHARERDGAPEGLLASGRRLDRHQEPAHRTPDADSAEVDQRYREDVQGGARAGHSRPGALPRAPEEGRHPGRRHPLLLNYPTPRRARRPLDADVPSLIDLTC